MTTAENILSTLSTLLTSSSTTAIPLLNAIGTHLQGNTNTNSSLASLLDQMQANPSAAPTYAALIASLPNVPAAVLTAVNGAVALDTNSTAFVQQVLEAKQALNQASSTNALGSLLAGLTLPTS